MATSTAAKARPQTIGAMTDKLIELREKKRKLEADVKLIEEEMGTLEEQLIERMGAEGTDKGSGRRGTCSITHSTVANVTDWDAFAAYIIKSKNVHLLQKRVSLPSWRELYESKGVAPPGTQAFSKKTLNVRTTV